MFLSSSHSLWKNLSATCALQCQDWADQDAPLQYRFGFSTVDGTAPPSWTGFGTTEFFDAVFPEGEIGVYAEVRGLHNHVKTNIV